jgi:adenine-specific DNA methylase
MYKHSEKQTNPNMKSRGVHAVSYTNITLCRPKQSSNKLKNQKHRRENNKKLMKIND